MKGLDKLREWADAELDSECPPIDLQACVDDCAACRSHAMRLVVEMIERELEERSER